MTDEPMLCELCGNNPVRRADQEYRESHPDDPWMVLCEQCDAASNGATPPRKGGKQPNPEAFGPKAAARRLEYLKFETRIETALFYRLSKRPMMIPKQFLWLNSLPEDAVRLLHEEVTKIKDAYGSYMYSQRGYELVQEGMNKYLTLCGTYQMMSGIAGYTGTRPKEEAPVEA